MKSRTKIGIVLAMALIAVLAGIFGGIFGSYTRENRTLNIAHGLTGDRVGLSNWGISPANLQFATDNDYNTGTTLGTTQVNGSACTYGTIMYDLGAYYDGFDVECKLSFGNNIVAGAYGRIYIEFGDNNSLTMRAGGYHSCVCEEWTQNQSWVQYAHAMGSGRYVLIGWYATASTGNWTGSIYELKVWRQT
jgi:hypothetical protein